MLKKSVYLIITALLTTSMVMSGCSSSKSTNSSQSEKPTSTKEKVTITFWDENSGPTRTPYYDELIKKFNSSQSEVQVDYVGIPQENALQKYNTAIAANEMPDVGGLQEAWVSNFIVRKALVPMDTYFDKWSEKDKMIPTFINSSRQLGSDKKLYMMPNTSNFQCIWYRPDLFKAAGLQFPTTWDDFFKDCEKLTDKSKNQYAYTIRGGSGSAAVLNDMLYAYSGITNYFDANGKCTISDPKHLEFLNKFFAMYKKYTPESDITSGWKEIAANYDTGVSAMLYHNLGSYSNHLDAFKDSSKFAAAPLPVSVKGYRVVRQSGMTNGYGIFSNSKHPEAGWKFVSYLCNAENQSYWNQNIGQMPTNKDVLSKDWVKKSQHINMALNTMSDKNTKLIALPLDLPDYSVNLSKTVEPGIQAVMAGKKTPQDLLKEWADVMEKSKADYDKSKK